jgi:hypothetical protein
MEENEAVLYCRNLKVAQNGEGADGSRKMVGLHPVAHHPMPDGLCVLGGWVEDWPGVKFTRSPKGMRI